MVEKYRAQPKDLVKFVADLEKRIDKLERVPRVNTTSIDDGSLIVNAGLLDVKGGDFTLEDENNVTITRFGQIAAFLRRGWAFYRSSGAAAFYIYGTPGAPQFVAVADNSNNVVFSDDAASGQGLATPYILVPPTPVGKLVTMEVTTTSGTFTSLYRFHGRKQHPTVLVDFVNQTPAGVTAEVRLIDLNNGNALIDGPKTVAANSNVYNSLRGPVSGSHLSGYLFELQMRVASGAGTVGCSVVDCYGLQS